KKILNLCRNEGFLLVYNLKSKVILVFSILLLSSLLVVSINGIVSGEVEEFSSLEEKVHSIIEDNEENVSVFIETSDGTIEINESEVMSSASIIKTPILIEALRQAEQGELVWHDEVTV